MPRQSHLIGGYHNEWLELTYNIETLSQSPLVFDKVAPQIYQKVASDPQLDKNCSKRTFLESKHWKWRKYFLCYIIVITIKIKIPWQKWYKHLVHAMIGSATKLEYYLIKMNLSHPWAEEDLSLKIDVGDLTI